MNNFDRKSIMKNVRKLLIIIMALTLASIFSSESMASKYVTKIDFEERGLDWPLSVDAGYLHCKSRDGLTPVWFETANGKKYNVNGAADTLRLFEPIEPIWANDGDSDDSIKVSISDLIKEGLKVCGDK